MLFKNLFQNNTFQLHEHKQTYINKTLLTLNINRLGTDFIPGNTSIARLILVWDVRNYVLIFVTQTCESKMKTIIAMYILNLKTAEKKTKGIIE